MYSFHFFKTERHFEFDIGSGIGVMCQFVVVMETIFVISESQGLMPFETRFFPFGEPLEFFARTNEKLHFHLFEFPHAENELARHDFVTECFSYLCDSKRDAHTSGLLHIQIVHKNTLGCFGSQVYFHGAIGCRTHFGREHQVELTHFGPVFRTTDRAYYFVIQNDLP